jgi:hypothetical protein
MSRAFSFGSIGEFTKFLKAEILARNLPMAREAALEAMCKQITSTARKSIGTYDYEWPELADATQDERERLGFARDEPLLRTGELRDSISYEITEPGKEAEIGSDSDVAVWQELGTETIPPRPFLLPSVFYAEHKNKKMLGDIIAAAMGPKFAAIEIVRIVADFLKDVAHDAKDTFRETIDNKQ